MAESRLNDLAILHDIGEAGKAAMEKHGPLTTDPVRACSILIRECGEAMNEALLATAPGVPDGVPWPGDWTFEQVRDRFRLQCRKNLYVELAQVAATAMLIMENIR